VSPSRGAGEFRSGGDRQRAATLGYTKIVARCRPDGLRQVDQGNIVHAADATGVAIITQLQPIAVMFSLPQQQIVRVNAASAKERWRSMCLAMTGHVVDTGTLTGIDNQVDPTTAPQAQGRISQCPFSAMAGQFVNVRLKVETLRRRW